MTDPKPNKPILKNKGIPPYLDRLVEQEQLSENLCRNVMPHYLKLADFLATYQKGLQRCTLIAINGAQGTGKSTLALLLKAMLEHSGLRVAILSIDDLYLTHQERNVLANTLHPLFKTRGAPGTHDIPLGKETVQQLKTANSDTQVAIPRFCKASDDRLAPADWPKVHGPIDLILLEGWCVCAKPQPPNALKAPINTLEATEDPQQIWRHYANNQLAGPYADFFEQFDLLIMLKAPHFHCAKVWRGEQEKRLAEKLQKESKQIVDNKDTPLDSHHYAPKRGLMDHDALERFMMHYERLTKAILEEMPQRADIIVSLTEDHSIKEVYYRCSTKD